MANEPHIILNVNGPLVYPRETGAAYSPASDSLSKPMAGFGWTGLNAVLSGTRVCGPVCLGMKVRNTEDHLVQSSALSRYFVRLSAEGGTLHLPLPDARMNKLLQEGPTYKEPSTFFFFSDKSQTLCVCCIIYALA